MELPQFITDILRITLRFHGINEPDIFVEIRVVLNMVLDSVEFEEFEEMHEELEEEEFELHVVVGVVVVGEGFLGDHEEVVYSGGVFVEKVLAYFGEVHEDAVKVLSILVVESNNREEIVHEPEHREIRLSPILIHRLSEFQGSNNIINLSNLQINIMQVADLEVTPIHKL